MIVVVQESFTSGDFHNSLDNKMKFKHKKDYKLFFSIHPILIMILGDMASYCLERNLPFVITSTRSTLKEDNKIKRRSSTHRTGRAADISVNGWDAFQIQDFAIYFNEKYEEYAALSSKTNEPQLVVFHVGTAPHIHVQVGWKYTYNL